MHIRQQQAKIKNLEKELVSKRTDAQRLRSEIARTSNEQINAIDDDDEEEVERLKRQVNRFRQLLQEANVREKDLEDEFDKVKGEKVALTRTLDQLELEKATLEKGSAEVSACRGGERRRTIQWFALLGSRSWMFGFEDQVCAWYGTEKIDMKDEEKTYTDKLQTVTSILLIRDIDRDMLGPVPQMLGVT